MSVYTISELKEKLKPIFIKYGIIKASIFGSYARGEALEQSDINLLIYINENFELEEYISFKDEVTKTIGKEVDLLEYRCIYKNREKEILKEAVLLYEE
jgi:predicted nucleotidyltransferase